MRAIKAPHISPVISQAIGNARFSYGILSKDLLCVCGMCVGTRAVTHVSKREDTLWNQSRPSTLSWVRGWTLGFQVCTARTLYWLSRPISPECGSFRWSSLQMVLCFGVKRFGQSWNPGFLWFASVALSSFTSGPHGFSSGQEDGGFFHRLPAVSQDAAYILSSGNKLVLVSFSF